MRRRAGVSRESGRGRMRPSESGTCARDVVERYVPRTPWGRPRRALRHSHAELMDTTLPEPDTSAAVDTMSADTLN